MIPIPPIWRTNINKKYPGIVNTSEILTTVKPVTLTALTAVKSASLNVHFTPSLTANGKESNIVDILTAKK